MRRYRTRTIIIPSALAALVAAARADAQPQPGPSRAELEAARHFDAGERFYEAGDFAQALTEYQRAYAIAPNPVPLFNIAKMYELQGKLPEALDWYERYLRESEGGKDHEVTRRRATNRVRALRNTPAKINVACDLRDSTPLDKQEAQVVLVGDDGTLQTARCDQNLEVRPGHYRLTIRAPNYESWERELVANIGQPYTYVADLRRKKGAVRIFADPEDALVLVDSTIRIYGAGVPTELPAGIHTLHVEAPGRVPDDRSLEVRADRDERVNVPLVRKPRGGQADLTLFSALYGGFVVPAAVRTVNPDLTSPIGLILAGGGAGLGAFSSFFLTDEKLTTGSAYFIMAGPLWGSFEGFGIGEVTSSSRTSTLVWTIGGGVVGLTVTALAARPVDSTVGDALLLHTGALWGTASGFMLWGAIGAPDPFHNETDLGKYLLAGLNVGLVTGLAFSGETEYTWSHVAMINLGTATSTAIFLGIGAATEAADGDQTRRWRFALGGMAAGLVASSLLTRYWDEPKYLKNLSLAPPIPRVEVAQDGSRRYLLDLFSGSW